MSGAVAQLAELVEASQQGWTGPLVEESVVASRDPEQAAGAVLGWAERELGARVHAAEWYHASVGMVTGLELVDGRRVVVKAFQPAWTPEFLAGVVTVQRWLSERWYPCGRPLAGPVPLGLGWATAETMLDDPGVSTDRDLVASVAGLCRMLRLTDGLAVPGLAAHPLDAGDGARYPRPHSPVFDFSRDPARWIDELADVAAAARAADRTRRFVGHGDWSARNVRWDRRGLQAVFDLDSLGLLTDSALAGQAAVTWAATMDEGERPLPGPAEIDEFLQVYQRVRGYRFRPAQVRAAWGSALWVLAYTARCEHALGHRGPATDALHAHADALALAAR